MKAAGIAPANRGSYFQNVPLVGVKADPRQNLRLSENGHGESFKFGDDFVATTGAQTGNVVGQQRDWYLSAMVSMLRYTNGMITKDRPTNYKGKVLVMLVNDPPATRGGTATFGGTALTYYGRWTYKYEEAARRGAAGVILIHTTESAGYGWNVVRTSNGNWRYEIARTRSDKTPFLPVKGMDDRTIRPKRYSESRNSTSTNLEKDGPDDAILRPSTWELPQSSI